MHKRIGNIREPLIFLMILGIASVIALLFVRWLRFILAAVLVR
jgi:hypothetical protein